MLMSMICHSYSRVLIRGSENIPQKFTGTTRGDLQIESYICIVFINNVRYKKVMNKKKSMPTKVAAVYGTIHRTVFTNTSG
jgi:hypothetical protein